MVASRQVLPSLLLLMLSSQQALFPTFQLLLLLRSADLPVLVVNSLKVFTDLFHRVLHSIGFYWRFWFLGSPIFRLYWFHFPTLFGNPCGLAWCFFLDARMGGVQSVPDPRVA